MLSTPACLNLTSGRMRLQPVSAPDLLGDLQKTEATNSPTLSIRSFLPPEFCRTKPGPAGLQDVARICKAARMCINVAAMPCSAHQSRVTAYLSGRHPFRTRPQQRQGEEFHLPCLSVFLCSLSSCYVTSHANAPEPLRCLLCGPTLVQFGSSRQRSGMTNIFAVAKQHPWPAWRLSFWSRPLQTTGKPIDLQRFA